MAAALQFDDFLKHDQADREVGHKVEADRIAAERGGKCLSSAVPTIRSLVVWKCGNHEHPAWSARFTNVRGCPSNPGNWCRRCYAERKAKMRLHTTGYVRAKLADRKIELCSEYKGVEEPIDCRCQLCGYRWTTRLRHINHGHGCPECGNRRLAEQKRYPTEHFIKVLSARRITLLSVDHSTAMTRLDCRCDVCGHAWKPLWNTIQGEGGCPACGRKRTACARRLSFDYVKGYLEKQGIELLSNGYKDSKLPLHVRFPCGCEGYAGFNSMRRGSRCAKCARNARVTPLDYNKLAALHGGQLLAAAATTNQLTKWKCRKGHTFTRPYSNIQQSGTFCPICSEGLSERICRAAAEQLFGTSFLKTKLRGVRGVGGRYLELDAYSESLKLAIEHNGTQHYQPVCFGNQTKADAEKCFRKQQEHDSRRRGYCRAKGITLIEVPELGRLLQTEDLREFIGAECRKANFNLPSGFDRVPLRLDAHHLATTAEEMWERVQNRIRELGYTLRTANYPGANERLQMVCRNGHDYAPKLASFLRGAKCQRCLIQQRAVPVVVLPLGAKAQRGGYARARVFDTIQDCAKALSANPNGVRGIAKGRGFCCMGFGIAQITQAQAECFRKKRDELESFCRAKWPSPEIYDHQDGSRKRLSKPVLLSDGREFPSQAAAGRALGVSKKAVAHAVRTGKRCAGLTIRLASAVPQ